MAAQRDASGKFIKGSGAPGWTPDAAKGADKATGAWDKAFGAANRLAGKGIGALFSGTKALTPAMGALGGAVIALATGNLPNATQAMTSFGAVIGGAATEGAAKLSAALGGLGPEGQAAGAAIEILTGAFAALFGTMTTVMGLAIDVTQHLDMMKARFASLAGSAAGGKAVESMLSGMVAKLPFGKDQIEGWGQALLASGIKGKQLEADIQAIAAATALMGEKGGSAAETLFKRLGDGGPAADKLLKTFKTGGPKADKLLKDMGLSIADIGGKAALSKMNATQLHEALAKAMAKKGAGPLKDMALTFPAILGKAREGFLSLFAKLGPSVKPFMTAIKNLFGHFNKGTPMMKTLQGAVTKVFGTLFGWATKVVNVIPKIFKWLMASGKAGGFFSGVVATAKVVWSKLVSIFHIVVAALKPIVTFFKRIFANAMVMKGIKTIFTVMAVVIGAVVLAIATLIGIFVVVGAAAAAFVGLVVGAFAGVIGEVASFVGSIVDAFTNLDFSAFVSKMAGMAMAGLKAFKNVLGIASPSKVMMKMGGHAATGAAQGMDAGTQKVEAAASRMGNAASDGASGAMKSGGGAKGGKSIQVTIESGAIVIHAGSANIDAAALAIELERALAAQGL